MRIARLLHIVVFLAVVTWAGGGGPTSATSAQDGCFEEDKYTENFETGWASNWYLGSGFQIVNDGSGKALRGEGASSASATYLFGDYWTDTSLGFTMKLSAGELWASLRYNSNSKDLQYDRILGKATDRYYAKFTSSSVVLVKTTAGSDNTLKSASTSFNPGRSYAVRLLAVGGDLFVYVDDLLVLSATDSNPVPSGSIALETKSNAQATVDDVQVVARVPCEYTWTRTATFPVGGDINVIAVDPRDSKVVYAGTEHMGVWKTTDGGLTWAEVGYSGDMGRNGKTTAIAIAPSNTAVVYASVTGEVDKSIDGGLHWTRTKLIDAPAQVRSLAVNPVNSDVVYAGLWGGSPAATGGIYKSSDGGENWQRLSTTSALTVVISASAPDTLYAGSTDGIYKSTDAGTNWAKVYSGTPSSIASNPSSSLAIDPTDPNIVYAVVDSTVKSTDGGNSWTKSRSGGTQVVLSPSSPNVIYLLDRASILNRASILKSTNRGDTWSTTPAWTVADSQVNTIGVDSSNANKVYLGTWGQGIFFSQDGGTTWSAPAVRSIPADMGPAIGADPSNENKVYVGTAFGEVYVSEDKGGSWTRLATLGTGSLGASAITGLVVDPLNASIIYASNVEGVYKSLDAGASWKTITTGLSDPRIISLAIDPKNSNNLFAGTGNSRPRNISEGTGIFYSSNAGASWSKVQGLPDAPIPAIVISPSETNILYVAAMNVGIYKSVNGGASWSQVNTGLKNLCVYALAIDPKDSNVAYAGTSRVNCATPGRDDNAYKTKNGGATWEIVLKGENTLDQFDGIVVDPSNPQNVYVANHTEKVWFSADAGSSWKLADKGVIRHGAHLYLWAIAFNSSGSTVYIATCGQGVLRNDLRILETGSKLSTTLTVSVSGSGAVTTSPSGTGCGTNCTSYAGSPAVTLTPAPSTGSVFAGWGGDADCLDAALTMSANRTCTATFVTTLSGGATRGVVDLNGDGGGDAFRYKFDTGEWAMDFGNRTGTFNERTGGWSGGWTVQAADFNGDKLTDFFLHNALTGQWFKAINNGLGDFSYFASSWAPRAWATTVLDLNGDGKSDLVLYDASTGDAFRCTSVGAGTEEFAYVYTRWSPGFQLYAADWNKDGKDDLFLYNKADGVYFRAVNDGVSDYSFTAGRWDAGWEIYPGDFTGDGRTDLYLSARPSGVWVVAIYTGSDFSYSVGRFDAGWKVFTGDFNGDSLTDLFVYNAAGQWVECFSNGRGGFTYASGSWDAGWELYVTDFDGDRKSDVLLYHPTTGTSFQAINTGVAAFAYTAASWGKGWTVVATSTRIP